VNGIITTIGFTIDIYGIADLSIATALIGVFVGIGDILSYLYTNKLLKRLPFQRKVI
jgi:hypothetical protein